MTTTFATTTLKTVTLEFTTAPIIRSVARRDIPEYGLLEGQVFYMARSSKNDGTYYILTWDYTAIRWNCSCPATTNNCRHHRLVKADCSKSHTVQGYKPSTKADMFAALVARYDVRSIEVIEEAANYTFREAVDPSPVRRYFTQAEIEAGLPEQVAQARAATAQREAELRAQAPLNGNRTFSFMR